MDNLAIVEWLQSVCPMRLTFHVPAESAKLYQIGYTGEITIGGETWTAAKIVEMERQPDGSADVTIEIPPQPATRAQKPVAGQSEGE